MHQGVNVPEFSSPLPNRLGVIVTAGVKRQNTIFHTARKCSCAQDGNQIKDTFMHIRFPKCAPNPKHPPQSNAWAGEMLTNHHKMWFRKHANVRRTSRTCSHFLKSSHLKSSHIQRLVFLHCSLRGHYQWRALTDTLAHPSHCDPSRSVLACAVV